MRNFLLSWVVIAMFFSCKKERPQPTMPTSIKVVASEKLRVFVLNQGVWPSDNSSVCLYDEKNGLISSDYFKWKNPSKSLGSVPQSMTKIGDHYFLVVNTAGTVKVLDTAFVQVGEVTNLNSPRFAMAAGTNKMYVSDLYADKITVVNTQDYTVSKTIKLKGWSEQMCSINNMVYVCNYDSSKLYAIDTNTDAVTDSILVGKGAEYMVKDKNNHLWILCTSIFNTEKKYLKCVDVSSKSILRSFEFSASESPTALQINGAGDQLYYINKQVYSMSINSTSLPASALIQAGATQNFYALGVNPENENIYVSDSKSGQAFDHVFVYSKVGEKLSEFESGYFTGYFYFDRK